MKIMTSAAAIAVSLLAGAAHAQALASATAAAPADAAAAQATGLGQGDGTGQTGQDGAAGAPTQTDVIVTGTRTTGLTAAESPTPIKVIDADTLSHVGQPNINQALTQLIPSFVAESFGGDTANLTLSARLRGLSPNHTLVLINGKRRHGTANLHVLGGAFQGGAAPDLDLISPESIQRIEVLEQGAAAQYGSDAIAGVINIILKSDSSGGSGNLSLGAYGKGDGETIAPQLHIATKVGEDGFFNVTAFYRGHDFSQVGGLDRRVTDQQGNLLASLSAAQRALYGNIQNFPYINKIVGDARSWLANVGYNTGYKFGGVEVYSFGTYSHRGAQAYENVRVPDRVIASPVLGVAGSLTTPGELIFAPNGFNPKEAVDEDDYAFTGGAKGELGGLRWEASVTYGEDRVAVKTLTSANASLFVDTHATPREFYDGFFRNQELTANLDVSKEIELGLAGPLTVAAGGEYRQQYYTIGQGDAFSTYKEGGQSYPGFTRTDAGRNGRDAQAAYLDLALNPVNGLKLDGAVRYEHYSDFGSKVIAKGTARYDFSPAFALRGTVSNGFRAPTLAEEFYSATNVTPTSATVQLPANSSAAALIGFSALKPETSMNYSAGIVLTPVERLTMTVDAYQVDVNNRIIGSGSIIGLSGGVLDPTTGRAVLAAIAAHGNVLDPTVTNVSVAAFTNAVDTRTRGIDATLSYPTRFGDLRINWTLSANYNDTHIRRIRINPSLLDLTATSILENGSPKAKVIAGAVLSAGKLSVTLRETVYGTTSSYNRYSGNYDFVLNRIGTAGITDAEVDWDATRQIRFAIGANNLLDKRPPAYVQQLAARGATAGLATSLAPSNGANVWNYPNTLSPYGINGGYYYGRVSVKF